MRSSLQWAAVAVVFFTVVSSGAEEVDKDASAGLVGEYFSFPSVNDFPDTSKSKPALVRVDRQVDFDPVDGEFYGTHLSENFYARWTGILRIETPGKYTLFTASDDGSRLFIDGKLTVDNGGPHGMTEKSGEAELAAGDHALKIEYFQGAVSAGCKVAWHKPIGEKEPVPAKVLFHKKGSENIEFDKAAWLKVAGKVKPLASKKAGGKWAEMNFGPFISSNLGVGGNNWTAKALSIPLNKEKDACICFDTELLRISAGWTGGYIDGRATAFSGDHVPGPMALGVIQFLNPVGPGWAKDGSFSDPREPNKPPNETKDGPLPRDWAKYKGLYLSGDKVVLSYTVGECKVLELPGVQVQDGVTAFTRTFNLGVSNKPMFLSVCEAPGATGSTDGGIATLDEKETQIKAGFVGGPKGIEWAVADSRIVLKFPALAEPATCKLVLAKMQTPDAGKFNAFLKDAPENLEPLTHGGPARWTEPVTTKGVLGKSDGPYVVDTLTAPEQNPWNSWLRFGGLDFFADGKRAAISTWSGDVWIVSGIDDNLETLTWKRYATGLFQALGLKIVDDTVYVVGRDQITRLHDLNNDGEADFYENFNNDCCVTTGFHEFTFDLQTDAEGNFYYAKGSPVNPGGRGFMRISAHNGCFLKVSKDGSKLEVVATGLRAPNGIGVGPNGELTCGDNQGSWVPECPLNLIKPGGFYGVVDSAHRAEKPTKRDNPICWLPYESREIRNPIDRSSGGQVWVPSDKWGPFKGKMLHLSYSSCALFEVMYEHVGDEVQGGVVQFPLNFLSGMMRGRFNPVDGQLYLCGLKGWQTSANREGAFQRVRYTGKPVHMPAEFHVTKTGMNITFMNALDAQSAADAENYSGQQYNIHWTSAYGSDEYKVSDPNVKGRDTVVIKSAKLSGDGKTVSLEIPDIKPVNNMIIHFKIKAADGTPISSEICNTINVLP